ncbi:G5 and 3D domain-containing protein [Tenuibacillus multivorans]|uniref:Uncharacterized conserved protein YabE, contains G5 and tandem DUF348 domains n=1 Tax=Tenuibacillus multivorans TaxID=237069 RepID=A0A1G9W0P2_9BACI|nr:G5 and 3D domain-containing protein [Tenuibacillus multivorans]GEL78270.1 hypothetical protein TMU01_25050 [Tenuibacillus multivorans]SDM78072.1 Uncharacterized conserved protein YabE, contains G5 and tandem DUF348 domains [Tenuibacillus multivorans]
MNLARENHPSRKRFSLNKMVLIIVSSMVLLGMISYITYETVTADVLVIQDGKEKKNITTADNVSELMDELGIDVSKHDDLSVALDSEIKDGMIIEYTKAKKITVYIDGKQQDYYTTEKTVKEFLNDESIKLNEHDEMSVALNKEVTDELEFSIQKGFEVTITDGGEKRTAMVTNQTVGDLLEEQNITLNEHDRVNAELDASVKDHRNIDIVRVTKETVTEEVAIPFQTETQQDSSMLRGNSEVLQLGSDGQKVQTFEVTKENGEVVSRELIEEEIVEESQNRIVAKGTKVPVKLASAEEGGDWESFTSTKYTAFCPSGCTGSTATGVDVSDTIYYNGMRIVAVDPNVIPLYSIVEVKTPNNTFKAIALDTGGSIKGKKIDILVDSRQEASRWGYRTVQVRMIDKN